MRADVEFNFAIIETFSTFDVINIHHQKRRNYPNNNDC